MKTPYFSAVLLLACTWQAAAGELTPAQRAEVESMLRDARASIKSEVLAEVCAQLVADGVVAPSCNASLQRQGHTSAPPVAVAPVTSSSQHSFEPPAILPQAVNLPAARATTDTNVTQGGHAFEWSASSENSRASIRASHQWSQAIGDGVARFGTTSMTLSAPVDKGSDFTNIATLDGFANASELALSTQRVRAKVGGPTVDMVAKLQALKKKINLPEKLYENPAELKAALDESGRGALYDDYEALLWNPASTFWVYGATAKVGYEKFDYFQSGSVSSADTTETPWAVGLYGGLFPGDGTTYYGASLEYQEAYKASKARTLCPISEDVTVVECVSGAVGPPAEADKWLASVEARKAWTKVGVTFRVTHDFEADDTGVDVPINLFTNASKPISGGVRLGWTNTDQFSFGIFVGAAFRIAPGE